MSSTSLSTSAPSQNVTAKLRACSDAPEVTLHDGQAVTTSLNVSGFFGRRHDDVLRKIERLIAEAAPDFVLKNFHQVSVPVTLGNGAVRQSPAWEMTRDGFTLLAMGFTGKEALAWKVRYIEAFNAMEAQLAAPAAASDTQPADALIKHIQGSRFLTTVDGAGRITMQPVPADAYVFSLAELPAMLMAPDMWIDRSLLPDIIAAAARRLGSKA